MIMIMMMMMIMLILIRILILILVVIVIAILIIKSGGLTEVSCMTFFSLPVPRHAELAAACGLD